MPRKSELVDNLLDVLEDPVWERMCKHGLGVVYRTRTAIHMGVLNAGLDPVTLALRDHVRRRIDFAQVMD